MKKSTKKAVMALIIVLIFGLSSVAFFFTGLTGFQNNQNQNQFTPLTNSIVKGPLPAIYKQTYVQSGWTWIEVYAAEPNTFVDQYIEPLPTTFVTPSGQPQIIVQEFNQTYNNETLYTIMTSSAAEQSFSGADAEKLFSGLCTVLTYQPVECSFNATVGKPANNTNSTNSTL